MKYQGSYMDSERAGLKDHAEHYPSSGFIDELAWGNIWVFWATQVSNPDAQTPVVRRNTACKDVQQSKIEYPHSPGNKLSAHSLKKIGVTLGMALSETCVMQQDSYLQECLRLYNELESWTADNYAYDWDNKAPALHVMLAQLFPSEMMQYSVNAQR